MRLEAEAAERAYDLNRAAELRHGPSPSWSVVSRPRRSSWRRSMAIAPCSTKW